MAGMMFIARGRAIRWILPGVLLAFSFLSVEAKPAKTLDIADTVTSTRILSRFAAIMQGSDLATFLSSKGPFTLFAPTDSAFSRLPPETLEALLQPQNKDRLQHILLFHVVNGKRLTAKDLLMATTLLSCEGNPLAIKKSRTGAQFVGKAKIVHADIRCLNGVIHEIDTVLMPPESALPPLLLPTPSPTPPPAGTVNSTNDAPVLSPDPPGTNSTIPVAPTAAPE